MHALNHKHRINDLLTFYFEYQPGTKIKENEEDTEDEALLSDREATRGKASL